MKSGVLLTMTAITSQQPLAVPRSAAMLLPIVAVVFADYLVIGIAVPVLPLHVHHALGFGLFVVGLVAGSQFGASLISRVRAGHFADSGGAEGAVVVGLITAAAAGVRRGSRPPRAIRKPRPRHVKRRVPRQHDHRALCPGRGDVAAPGTPARSRWKVAMRLLGATLASLCLIAAASAQGEKTAIEGPTPMTTFENVQTVAPALEKYAQGVLLGDLWKRPGLSTRDRSIVTVAALIARNQTVELPYYLNLALDNGVKPSEISEIITHLAFYSGWANATSAVIVAKDVFAARNIGTDQLPAASPPLLPLNEAAEAQRATRVEQQFGGVVPGIVQYTTDVLFRDLWLRPDLAPRDRSLVTVSALIASGQVAQLPSHLNRAMDNGLTQAQAAEALTHLAFYVGWPNVFSALPVAKEVFEKRAH
jgi:4-carboxymuconolactone decarboxylase